MKYLVNFKLKPQKGWSEIVDVESDLNDSDAKYEAKQKAAEMLKHRLLNDGIFTFIDKADIEPCPMEWEKLKHEKR
tara:strand:+ start:38 stop:265 length:228 start_codon:yes stop_codon:yes gene_type:complete